MIATLLLAQVLAAAPATTATPVAKANTGQTRTLADVARERKLGKRPASGGTLSVAGISGAPPLAGGSSDKAATDADARLARAIRDGAWVDQNIHYHEGIKEGARREWDAAAENCRKTPGCTPIYRENVEFGGVKPLRTGDEVLRDRTLKQDSVEPLGK
jgi:hypothetical protein